MGQYIGAFAQIDGSEHHPNRHNADHQPDQPDGDTTPAAADLRCPRFGDALRSGPKGKQQRRPPDPPPSSHGRHPTRPLDPPDLVVGPDPGDHLVAHLVGSGQGLETERLLALPPTTDASAVIGPASRRLRLPLRSEIDSSRPTPVYAPYAAREAPGFGSPLKSSPLRPRARGDERPLPGPPRPGRLRARGGPTSSPGRRRPPEPGR